MLSLRRWAVTVISWIASLLSVSVAVAPNAIALKDELPKMAAIAYDNFDFMLHPF
jgi:hypothetical protein